MFTYDYPFIETVVMARPSVNNKSPYVGDIQTSEGMGITHMPSLDLGGKCIPGTVILVTQKRDKKGILVGQEYSKKYGTPSTMYIAQLVKSSYSDVWIGAHPSQGEKLFKYYTKLNVLPHFTDIVNIKSEVANVAGCNMRSDFLVTHTDGSHTLVEVKTIVDIDRDRSPNNYVNNLAVFPWGKPRQKDELTGKKVVSSRAIKHVRELTSIANGTKHDLSYPNLKTAVVFMVVRKDATAFIPDFRTCPVFHQEVCTAKKAGVAIYCYSFDMRPDGCCPFIAELPVLYGLN